MTDIPQNSRPGTALVVMDGNGATIHHTGPLQFDHDLRTTDAVARMDISGRLPHWSVCVFMDDSALSGSNAFLVLALVLVGILVTAIVSAGVLITRLINNILDFGKLEQGQKQYRISEFDMGQFLIECIRTNQIRLKKAGFKLITQIPDQAVPVKTDRDAMAQVFVNLMDNAIKYAGSGRFLKIIE